MMDALSLLMVVDDNIEDHMGAYGYIICLLSTACKRQATGGAIKLQKTAEFEDISSANYLAKLEFGLQRGSLRMEIVQDEVALDVKTPTMIASTVGKNTFGVAYDPDTGRSSLSAYQNPVSIQPSNSNLAPFTLAAGQQVEVSSEGIGPVTPLGQTTGVTEGSTHVSPDGRVIYGPVGGAENAVGQTGMTSEGPQSGCYADPFTGQTICVDTFGNPINPSTDEGTAHMMQPDSGSSIPQRLQECETSTSEICGTWTRTGDRFNAQWNNGASATLNVERWDNDAVVITRQDTQGSSAGLTARYEGIPAGNHVDGTVTWNWNGDTWSGTWTADW